ncbi:MAG TPA: diguanylate cyclase [Gemmatimonadales bacterium]|nr:diguanylate cyclase [Gemmatimonadales bacterium]
MGEIVRVLLVDDDEEDFLLTRDLFRQIDAGRYVVEWAASYDEGLAAVSRQEHDVCLIDYRLGPANGLDLLREAIRRGVHTPLILLTGQGDHEVDVQAMKEGAADYLIKGRVDAPLLERSVRYAIERARTLAALRELAIRDELTGLYNRREMCRLLKEEVARCWRYAEPMALVMIDIDHFKAVNDTFGHQAGDEVLRWIARLLRQNLRSVDQPARYGGEELAVILPEMTDPHALEMAERLRQVVAAEPFRFVTPAGGPVEIPITISLGVAYLPDDADSDDGLIAAADAALYEAKRRGRNQAVRYRELRIGGSRPS